MHCTLNICQGPQQLRLCIACNNATSSYMITSMLLVTWRVSKRNSYITVDKTLSRSLQRVGSGYMIPKPHSQKLSSAVVHLTCQSSLASHLHFPRGLGKEGRGTRKTMVWTNSPAFSRCLLECCQSQSDHSTLFQQC